MIELTTLEPHQKLTYEELVNILCILAVKIERLEGLILDFFDLTDKNDEFQTKEILKARMEIIRHKDKDTPFKRFISKRVKELDESFKGFFVYYHENLAKEKETKKRKSKYD